MRRATTPKKPLRLATFVRNSWQFKVLIVVKQSNGFVCTNFNLSIRLQAWEEQMRLRRREFIAGFGGAALRVRRELPCRPGMPVVGYLSNGTPETSAPSVAAFRKGLSEMGYAEGRNVTIEYRLAEGHYDRLPELAADLVHRRVAVIAASSTPAALAAKAATATIPIIFSSGVDPVKIGLVASFNRPGGNLTGVTSISGDLSAKRLGLLHELLPRAARFAVLVDPNATSGESVTREVQTAAASINQQIEVLHASTNREINTAFESLVQKRADALLVPPNILFLNRRVQLVTLAAHHRVPTIYPYREFVQSGGLMSYAPIQDQARQVGIYAGRILKGEKPTDLPVMLPTNFEFVINLQTAGVLGTTIPPTLLALADGVIE
jgi:putative ABC transport system substrate-binding protein